MRLCVRTERGRPRAFFYNNGDKKDELYLNLVLEFVPETVCTESAGDRQAQAGDAPIQIKLLMYQVSPGGSRRREVLLTGAAHAVARLHPLGGHLPPRHQTPEPASRLGDGYPQAVRLGSAKILVVGEPNVSYICSRYYRAPN